MNNCCSSILDIGCIGFCDTISTGVTAPASDTYVISVVGSGGYASYVFTAGQEITFTNPFNEDSTVIFQILRDGAVISSGIYDCFQVEVKSGINITGNTENMAARYKVYTALLTQSGMDAPTAVVLENTIGTIVWSYSSAGEYQGTLNGAFTLNKSWAIGGTGSNAATILFFEFDVSANVFNFFTHDVGTGSNEDDRLLNTPIEIRVYY